AWAAGATVYQVFPDRFANGNPANDPSPSAVPGTTGADRDRFGDVYGNPILVKAWTDLPEGYCRASAPDRPRSLSRPICPRSPPTGRSPARTARTTAETTCTALPTGPCPPGRW
ncbi:MAG: hypothetical protein ACXWO7_08040, partial [Candidatus Limnocylindrales bacterium]